MTKHGMAKRNGQSIVNDKQRSIAKLETFLVTEIIVTCTAPYMKNTIHNRPILTKLLEMKERVFSVTQPPYRLDNTCLITDEYTMHVLCVFIMKSSNRLTRETNNFQETTEKTPYYHFMEIHND